MNTSCDYVSDTDTDTHVVVNITKMTGTCRLCLKESTKLSPIFCDKQGRKHFFDLYRKIFICCGIDINEYDELSSFICNECVTKLNAAYDFRLVCQRSNSSYCRLQTHTSKDCACLNSNAETEIPKVKKIIKICESMNINRQNADVQDSETNDHFQVNGVSTTNGDDNQVNGLSVNTADEKNDKATDVSMTDSPGSSKSVGSKTTEDSINRESSGKSDNDIDDLPYEKRLEIARNKYKDILILNKLNIPPKKISDLVKLTNKQNGCSNDVNVSNVAGANQKVADADDANSIKDSCVENSQPEDNNDTNFNQTIEVTVTDKNKSVDKHAKEQIKDTNRAVNVHTSIVEEVDHSFDFQEEIIVAFDENIQVSEEIAIEVHDNQEIQTIIFHPLNQKTVEEEQLVTDNGFVHDEQNEVEQANENIETEVVNAGDQPLSVKADKLDIDKQVFEKDSNLVVKDIDISIAKPKKYFKNNPQVPNKRNVKVGNENKNLSSRKRPRSKELNCAGAINDVPAIKQDESKRRKSAKTKKSNSPGREREDDHCYVSQGEVINSSNSIEVQADVHIREISPEFPEPAPKINGSNIKVQKEANKNRSPIIDKINGTMDNLDQILNLEDDIDIDVAQNIEILPENALSVDYTVGIPVDDVHDSSDDAQVPKSNLVIATDNNKELDGNKDTRNTTRKKKGFKNSKSKPLVAGNNDSDHEKDSNRLPKDSVNNKKKVLKKKKRSQNVVAVKKNIKVKIIPHHKSKQGKNKIRSVFKKPKKKLIVAEKSAEDDSSKKNKAVTTSEDDGDTSPDIVRFRRSRVNQLSSSDENLTNGAVVNSNDSKKWNKSKSRKSSPLRPSNSGRMREKQLCKYCDRSFLYRLPLMKHLKLQHGNVNEDMGTKEKEEVRQNSLLVNQNLIKKCRVILTRLKR